MVGITARGIGVAIHAGGEHRLDALVEQQAGCR